MLKDQTLIYTVLRSVCGVICKSFHPTKDTLNDQGYFVCRQSKIDLDGKACARRFIDLLIYALFARPKSYFTKLIGLS